MVAISPDASERILQLLSVLLFAVAAYFLWQDAFDWAFASAIFAICSAFLGYRFRLRSRLDASTTSDEE